MKRLAVATAVLALALSACGGGGEGRPSTDDIATSLKDADNAASALATGASDDAIDCIAKAFHDSDLSDEALRAIVEGDEDYQADDDDNDAMKDLSGDFSTCVTA